MLHFLTDLGDSALLVPASALLLAYLLYRRSIWAASIWISTLALCAALTVLLKIGFHACGAEMPLLDMRSPSGHASLSTTFYSCCALMVTGDKDRRTRLLLLLASAALATVIAISRVILQAHTVSEVIAGLSIGVCCVGWFGSRYFARQPFSLPWQPMIIAIFIVALLTHGWHLDAEGVVEHVARLFRSSFSVCA